MFCLQCVCCRGFWPFEASLLSLSSYGFANSLYCSVPRLRTDFHTCYRNFQCIPVRTLLLVTYLLIYPLSFAPFSRFRLLTFALLADSNHPLSFSYSDRWELESILRQHRFPHVPRMHFDSYVDLCFEVMHEGLVIFGFRVLGSLFTGLFSLI